MNKTTENWLLRGFIVLYAATCLYAVMTSNNPQTEKCMNIAEFFPKELIVPGVELQNGECLLISMDENDNIVDSTIDYQVTEKVSINDSTLACILDKQYYIAQSDAVAEGLFIPNVSVRFNVSSGDEFVLLYSFMNAEVRIFKNNELSMICLMYNPNELDAIFESIIK